MHRSRWIVGVGLLAISLACAGCLSDEVVYVDAQGNELAVDADGRPILPGRGGSGAAAAPALATAPDTYPAAPPPGFESAPALPGSEDRVAAEGPGSRSRPAAAPGRAPAPDPTWNLPAAAQSPSRDVPGRSAAKPAQKIEDSSNLDLPPAG